VTRLRWADERGELSLIELLVAISIFAGVLGATLFTFETFNKLNRRTVDRAASQDSARTSVDRLVRDLRNLASPTIYKPQAVDRAESYDLVFQTVDPSTTRDFGANSGHIKRERWCLDQTNDKNEVLYVQNQYWTSQTAPDTFPSTGCGVGWEGTTVLATNLTNTYKGQSRPLFTYNSGSLKSIDEIHVDLYSDIDPLKAPNETHITSGVFLRNQNQVPVADFTKALSGTTAIVLNGSASFDPEGQELQYVWWDNGHKITDAQGNVATGITYTYPVTSGSSHSLELHVFDPSTLEGVSPTQTIKVP
jgi:type II secretory pathway pseudopilin PulG